MEVAMTRNNITLFTTAAALAVALSACGSDRGGSLVFLAIAIVAGAIGLGRAIAYVSR